MVKHRTEWAKFSLDTFNYWRIHWVVSFLGGFRRPKGIWNGKFLCPTWLPIWMPIVPDMWSSFKDAYPEFPCFNTLFPHTNEHVEVSPVLLYPTMSLWSLHEWLGLTHSHRKNIDPRARDQLLGEFEAINHEATLEVHASQLVLLRSASHSFSENRVVIYMALDWKTGMNSVIYGRKRMINTIGYNWC